MNFNNLKIFLSTPLGIQYLSVWQDTHWVLRNLEYKLKKTDEMWSQGGSSWFCLDSLLASRWGAMVAGVMR